MKQGLTRKLFPLTSALIRAATVTTVAIGCAGTDPFVKASGEFANATKAGADVLAPSFAVASELCRTRSRLAFLFAREQGIELEALSKWYSAHDVGDQPGNTWKAQCEALASSDAMQTRGLQAIGAYAEALKAAADASGYDGRSLETLVTDSAALAEKLASNATETKTVTDKVAGLSGPIGTIGRFAVQAYAAGKLRSAVNDGAPAVSAILDSLREYNTAIRPTIEDAERQLANVLDQADASIRADDAAAGRTKPEPMRLIALHEVAVRYELEIASVRKAWTAYGRAIESMRKANTAMAAAASGTMSDTDALKLVLGFASEVVTQLAEVKASEDEAKE